MIDFSMIIGEDSSKFILKYKVINNTIIITFANGEKLHLPYTKDNEDKVLKKMEEQGRKLCETTIGKSGKIVVRTSAVPWGLIHGVSGSASIFTTIIMNLGGENISLLGVILGMSPLLMTLFMDLSESILSAFEEGTEDVNRMLNEDEKEKIKLYFEFSDKLNEFSRRAGAIMGVSKKTLKLINETPEDRDVFDINTIDEISLKDLQTIKNNIEKSLLLGLDGFAPEAGTR